jgi:hypothetical protein
LKNIYIQVVKIWKLICNTELKIFTHTQIVKILKTSPYNTNTLQLYLSLKELLDNPTKYPDFENLSYWQTRFDNAIAIAVFFAWIKVNFFIHIWTFFFMSVFNRDIYNSSPFLLYKIAKNALLGLITFCLVLIKILSYKELSFKFYFVTKHYWVNEVNFFIHIWTFFFMSDIKGDTMV